MNELPIHMDDWLKMIKQGSLWKRSAMKAGFPAYNDMLMISEAWQWMKEHPNFNPSDYKSVKLPQRKKQDPQLQDADKSDERYGKNEKQTASPGTSKHFESERAA